MPLISGRAESGGAFAPQPPRTTLRACTEKEKGEKGEEKGERKVEANAVKIDEIGARATLREEAGRALTERHIHTHLESTSD